MSAETFFASRRFGFGPSLAGGTPPDVLAALHAEAERRTAPLLARPDLPTARLALAELGEFQTEARNREMARMAEESAREMAVAQAQNQRPKPVIRPAQRIFNAEAQARLEAAIAAPIGFGERLTWFWANHFCVAVAKGDSVRITAGALEREAIRPHVFGSFRAMLQAVMHHPAMLIYLDQRQSVGPDSRAGTRRGRGLNENLARELLELHTLGVDGGYRQDDVTTLAKVLTGWTVAGRFDEDGDLGAFYFNANRHDPGPKTLLGRTYADDGLGQGEKVLDDLARHPATAHHISQKLARHFIADEPPPAVVARLAETFTRTGGDLGKVSLALLDVSRPLGTPAKLRQPLEFVVTALRATGRPLDLGQALYMSQLMGQGLWNPSGPNGFPDTDAQWAAPETLKVRLEAALTIARQTPGTANPSTMLAALLGPAAAPATVQAVSRAESRAQGLALMLMSPDLQRR